MEPRDNKACIVLCTCPDAVTAELLSGELVEARLAACVNIVPEIQSVYRWDDEVQSDAETLMVIKTVTDRYDELEAHIKKSHPYDVPEILLIPVSGGLADYLDWVSSESN